MKLEFLAFVSLVLMPPVVLATEPPEPLLPVPTERQLRWHEMEYYGFVHYTTNTFTGLEWGYGDESPEIFNPSDADANQWASVAKRCGMKGLILTAKHHDGFCLWPSQFTEHSVKASPYQQGQGDVVNELAEACRQQGIRMGLYLSPWDRNHAEYGSTEYITYYRNQLRELMTNYGPLFEVWFDGANGGDGFYGGAREKRKIDSDTYYDWDNTWAIVRELQPMAVMFSDAGPDIRWVGNESGTGSETNWAMLRRAEFSPGRADRSALQTGQIDGTHWLPAEVDVSIRPGWFYHAEEDDQVKSLERLIDIYYSSIGNGANLLLNIPPDRRGRFHEKDVERLMQFGRVIEQTFKADLALGASVTATNVRGQDDAFGAAKLTDGDRNSYWAADDQVTTAELVLHFEKPTEFDRIRIQEYIPLGQRVQQFAVDAELDHVWQEIASGTTIGPRRVLRVAPITAEAVRIRIKQSRACPTLSTMELYKAPQDIERVANQNSYFLIGNSLTWDTRPTLLDGDVQFHVDCGKSLPYIRDHFESPCVKESTLWPEALAKKQYDAIVVQPHYGSTLDEDEKVIGEWVKMQPNAMVVLHSGWAKQGTRELEFNNTEADGLMKHSTAYLNALTDRLKKRYPKQTFRQTYATELLAKVAADIKSGDAPFASISELYRDEIHMTHGAGRYLMHNAMRTALGQPKSNQGFESLQREQKAYLDETLVWHQNRYPSD
ncbi:alpha-L-fucosidase [Novipirellula artificiosorum]|uniref:alpha-L-fucosidase n=1 Tax=Novipirellula artificiosorum TaxID=2528016 RepID=A0A5C6DWU6_9BACT|nr:alpha-L-fucosidase [Novipirellula artificiosorum]TWU40865.1 Alpha-L-fucosidase [Novipirellula artificiosorum]